jgi:V8-like Glu-specific endopeptidase
MASDRHAPVAHPSPGPTTYVEAEPLAPGPDALDVALEPMARFGDEDRTEVTRLDYPYSAICALRSRFADGSSALGTGWVAGAGTIVTAGHCVYDPRAGWASDVEVVPRRLGSRAPFGTLRVGKTVTTRGWVDHGDAAADYGALLVAPEVYDLIRLGAFGWEPTSDDELLRVEVAVSGYPRDLDVSRLFEDRGRLEALTAGQLFYRCDTGRGQSGAPVWYVRDGAPYVAGIHNLGDTSAPDGRACNAAVRMSGAVMDNLVAWQRAGR